MRNPSGGGAGHAVPGFLSPFRLSAFASWVILRPLGKFSLPRGRPTGGRPAGPQRGCRVAHEQDPTGQGALLTPGTVVRSRPTVVSGRHPPLRCGQSLYPAGTSHRRGSPSRDVIKGSLTFAHHPKTAGCRPRTGSVAASRRSSPRPPPPNGTRAASASTPGFAPRGYPRRTPRRRQAIAH